MRLILFLASLIFLQNAVAANNSDLACHEHLLAHVARQSTTSDKQDYEPWDQLPETLRVIDEGILLIRFSAESVTDLSPARAQVQQVAGIQMLPRSEFVHNKTMYIAVYAAAPSLRQLAERIQNLQDRLASKHWSFQLLALQSKGVKVDLAPPLEVLGFESNDAGYRMAYTLLPGLLEKNTPILIWRRFPAQMVFIYPQSEALDQIIQENQKRFGFDVDALDPQRSLMDWLRSKDIDETLRLVRYYGTHIALTRAAFNALAVRQGEIFPGKMHFHPSVAPEYGEYLKTCFSESCEAAAKQQTKSAYVGVMGSISSVLAAPSKKAARVAVIPIKLKAKKAKVVPEPKPQPKAKSPPTPKLKVAPPPVAPKIIKDKVAKVELPPPVAAPVTGVKDLSLATAQEFVELVNEYGGAVASEGFVRPVFQLTQKLNSHGDEFNRLNNIGLKKTDYEHIMGEDITRAALGRCLQALRIVQLAAGQKAVGPVGAIELQVIRQQLNPGSLAKPSPAPAKPAAVAATLVLWETLVYHTVEHKVPNQLEPYLNALDELVEKVRHKNLVIPLQIKQLAHEWPDLEGDLVDESAELLLRLGKVAEAIRNADRYTPPAQDDETEDHTPDLEWVLNNRAAVTDEMEFKTVLPNGEVLHVQFAKSVVKNFFADVSVHQYTFEKLIHAISKGISYGYGIQVDAGDKVHIRAQMKGAPKLYGTLSNSILKIESFTK